MGVLAYERGANATSPTFLSDEEWQLLGGNGTWVRANECYAPGPVVDGGEMRRRQKMERYEERPQDPRHSVRECCIQNAELQRRQAEKLNEEANERDREAIQLRDHAHACVEQARIFKDLADSVYGSMPAEPFFKGPEGANQGFAEELLEPAETCSTARETIANDLHAFGDAQTTRDLSVYPDEADGPTDEGQTC